jgi:hypothetical protein
MSLAMSQGDSVFWSRARLARDKLVDRFLGHSDVSLIDIGRDPEAKGTTAADQIVLRVHVRRPLAAQVLELPEQVDGIPVRVIVADYRLE